MKAAEDCIGLINVGVDPDHAMAKLARENDLNDKEVDLVSRAVNNSKQVAQIQNSEPDQRDAPFLLVNAASAKALARSLEQNGAPSTKAKQDQPDAVVIREDLAKQAADSYRLDGTLFDQPVDRSVDLLKAAWAVPDHTRPEYRDDNFNLALSRFEKAAEVAGDNLYAAKVKLASQLRHISNLFGRFGAPTWATFEKAAQQVGVSADTIDSIWQVRGQGDERVTHVKVANLRVDPATAELIQESVRADTFLKEAAELDALHDQAVTQLAVQNAKYAGGNKGGDKGDDGWAPWDIKAELSPKGFGDAIGSIPTTWAGLGESPTETVLQASGSEPGAEIRDAVVPQEARQTLQNAKARDELERLMTDPYVKGFSLPDVIDAYNAAMSVNPRFGSAEITSYVRQHLSTRGGVPLDLQVRASTAHGVKETPE